MNLPDDYADRCKALDAFIRCPECGSERATLVIDEGFEPSDQTDFRAACPGCDHTSPWVRDVGDE